MEGYQRGRGMGENVQGIKYKWQVQNRQGKVQNSMENGEAKEPIYLTHGCELRWGNAVGGGVQGRGE